MMASDRSAAICWILERVLNCVDPGEWRMGQSRPGRVDHRHRPLQCYPLYSTQQTQSTSSSAPGTTKSATTTVERAGRGSGKNFI